MNLKEKILSTHLSEDQIAIFYTGQVGFIIKFHEKYILIDGYLSDYIDKNCSNENVKWVRNYPAPITGGELDFMDYVFCTHSHLDHADPETLSEMSKVNNKAKYFVSEAIKDTVLSYIENKDAVIGVYADKEIILGDGISFIPVPSAHEELHKDENGNYLELGFKFKLGNTGLYHSGDCCMYEDLAERINGTDILMLPINGRDYFRNSDNIIGCFDSVEAITLAKKAGAKLLIPTHFDLYSVNAVNPAYFVDCLYRINPTQSFHIFMPGERYIYE